MYGMLKTNLSLIENVAGITRVKQKHVEQKTLQTGTIRTCSFDYDWEK